MKDKNKKDTSKCVYTKQKKNSDCVERVEGLDGILLFVCLLEKDI